MITRVAVIGVGHWGPHLIRNFHDNRLSEVIWAVDPDEDRLALLRERFSGLSLTTDPEVALSDERVDAAVIAAPSSDHFELARHALLNGKHVLVEKPMTTSAETARVLCAMAETQGRVLMVGHVFLFNPAIRAAKSYFEDGSLGQVYYISMARTNLGPVRLDVNAAWDLASHDIAIANYWLDSTPVAISAIGGAWLNANAEDAVFATIRYPGHRLVHVEASWLHPRKSRRIAVIGESKMLTVDDMEISEPLRVYDKAVVSGSALLTDTFVGFRSQIREGTITIPRVAIGEPLLAECDAFLARIRGDQDRLSDGWFGLDVVRALEAVDVSMKDGGREVDVAAR